MGAKGGAALFHGGNIELKYSIQIVKICAPQRLDTVDWKKEDEKTMEKEKVLAVSLRWRKIEKSLELRVIY